MLRSSSNIDVCCVACDIDVHRLTGWLECQNQRQAIKHNQTNGQTNDRHDKEVSDVKPDQTSPPADEEEIEGTYE